MQIEKKVKCYSYTLITRCTSQDKGTGEKRKKGQPGTDLDEDYLLN
jgi:hypothetical protein